MAAIQNTRDLLLQAAAIRVVPVMIDPALIPGLTETIGAVKGIKLSAPSNVFQIGMGGVASPSAITLTATLTIVTSAVTWSVTAGTATLTGTGNSRTLSAASMTSNSVTIRASVTEAGVTYNDYWTIAKTADGQAGINGANGTNGDSVDIVYQRSASQPATPGASAGTPAGWYSSVSAVPAGGNPIWSSVGNKPGVSSNYTWQTPLKIEGSAGASGLSVAELTVFRRDTGTPATPSGGSFNFSTNTLTPPSGWSAAVPAGTNPVYTSRAIASISGTSGSASPGAWSAPTISFQNGADGANGANGERGSITAFGTLSNLVAYPSRGAGRARWAAGSPTDPNAVTADTAARNVIWQRLGNSGSAPSNAHMRLGDTVTLTNSGQTVSATGYWTGAAWDTPGMVIDGNLLVGGNISGQEFTGGTFTGAVIRTAPSGGRFEFTSSALNGYDTSGELTFIFTRNGQLSLFGEGLSGTPLNINPRFSVPHMFLNPKSSFPPSPSRGAIVMHTTYGLCLYTGTEWKAFDLVTI